MSDVSTREKVVLEVLQGGEQKTSEVLQNAQEYEEELKHNRQITRVFDSLEEEGMVKTRRDAPEGPLAGARLARLTEKGREMAEDVAVTPLQASDREELEELVWETREDVDELRSETAQYDAIDRIEERLEEVEARIEAQSEEVNDAKQSAEQAEQDVSEACEQMGYELDQMSAVVDKYKPDIERLEERVDDVEATVDDVDRRVHDLSADLDSLVEFSEENRGYIMDFWNRLWGDSEGDGR